MGPGYGMMGGFSRFGFGWFGWIFQIIVLAAVVYLVFYVVRAYSPNHKHHASSSEQALQILAERFARGEISAEEYKAMKEQLK